MCGSRLGSVTGKKERPDAMKLCDVRLKDHFPGHVTHVCGKDQSGTVVYFYNSHGYRSEEYDPDAKFRLCVIGESHAFGFGVAFEESFGFRVKEHIARALDYQLEDVNLINLSVGSVSSDYCVRTIYRQIQGLSTDLLIYFMPPADRVEYIMPGRNEYRSFSPSAVELSRIADAPSALLGFCEYYNNHVGNLNLLKNALLAQTFLQKHGVSYIFTTQDLPRKEDGYAYLRDYFEELDSSAVLWHEFFKCNLDTAADGHHGGPSTHAAFATEVLSFYAEMLLQRGDAELGTRLGAVAAELLTSDENWARSRALIAEREKGKTKMGKRRAGNLTTDPADKKRRPKRAAR